MAQSITFIPVRRGGDPKTLAGSLAQNGMARLSGCRVTLCPMPDINGTIRTGMDENALYITQMPDGPEKDAEIHRVKTLREELERRTGIKLGPRDPYFAQFGQSEDPKNPQTLGEWISLPDEPVTYDFSNPIDAITAAWLRVSDSVAPSQAAFRTNPKASYLYYIKDEEAENKIAFEDNKKINKAVVKLDDMNTPELRKIAMLLDLPVSEESPHENVYNLVTEYLRQKTVKTGAYKGRLPVSVFNEVLELGDAILNVRLLIKQAIRQDIYRKTRGQMFEGESMIAATEEELQADLLKDTQMRVALEKKVKNKRNLNKE